MEQDTAGAGLCSGSGSGDAKKDVVHEKIHNHNNTDTSNCNVQDDVKTVDISSSAFIPTTRTGTSDGTNTTTNGASSNTATYIGENENILSHTINATNAINTTNENSQPKTRNGNDGDDGDGEGEGRENDHLREENITSTTTSAITQQFEKTATKESRSMTHPHKETLRPADIENEMSTSCPPSSITASTINQNNTQEVDFKKEYEPDHKQLPQHHSSKIQYDDTLEEIFPDMRRKKKKKKKNKNKDTNAKTKHPHKYKKFKQKKNKNKNVINIITSMSSNDATSSAPRVSQMDVNVHSSARSIEETYCFDRQRDDSLDFYSEIHEDQDPETIDVVHKISKQWLDLDLKKLAEQDEETKMKLTKQLKKKQDDELQQFRHQVRAWTKHLSDKQEKQRISLIEQKDAKISEARDGMNYLINKNSIQVEAVRRKYQQQPWSKEAEQRKSAEINKIQNKLHEMQKSIKLKLQVYQTTKEADYKKNRTKLEKHHLKRKAELFLAIQKNQATLDEKQNQREIYHETSHEECFQKLRQEAMKNRSNFLHHSTCADQPDLNLSCLSRTKNEETVNLENINGAAILRCKHREAINSKCHIPATLAIEIHNEGLRLTWRSNNDLKENAQLYHDFQPWGFKARQLLHSVVCGEFPISYGKVNVEKYIDAGLQGGHIKCLLGDMRTKNGSSVSQLKEAEKTSQIKKSESSVHFLRQSLENASRTEASCKTFVQKSSHVVHHVKTKLLSLQTQTRFMRNPDGTLKLNSESETAKKIVDAFDKYEKEVIFAENKMRDFQQQLVLAQKKKAEVQESYKRALNQSTQQPQQSIDRVSDEENDISSIITSIKKAVCERRSIMSDENLIDSKGYPEHGNLISIILRPTKSRTYQDFKDFLKRSSQKGKESKLSTSMKTDTVDTVEYDPVRTEELLLLSLYPSWDTLPSAPAPDHTEAKPWAEPGYQLSLDVPKSGEKRKTILPSIPNNIIFRQMYSEYSSTQGRQASTFLSKQHYKNIGCQGSTIATLMQMKANSTDEDVSRGYEFQPQKKVQLAQKYEGNVGDTDKSNIDEDISINSTKKRQRPSVISSVTNLHQGSETKTKDPPLIKQPTIPTQAPSRSSYTSNGLPMTRINDQYDPYNTIKMQNQTHMFNSSTAPQVQPPPSPLQYHSQQSYHGRTQYAMQQRMPHLQYQQVSNVVHPPYQHSLNKPADSTNHSLPRKG